MPICYSVIVIGAGESGIAVGCMLKSKLRTTDFRIFDRQGGVGGAWYANKYPGVACDIPAIFYSYSFAPNHEWTTLFPSGQEIQHYLEGVCDKFNIRNNIQLSTEVSSARWIENESEWEVKLTSLVPRQGTTPTENEVLRCKVLVTCCGELVEPNLWPRDVPGIDSFQGQVFHSAQWNDDVDLAGKDVVVIGAGCTAAQLVPALTRPPFSAKSVMQLMRTPPWVIARPEAPQPKLMETVSFLLRTVPGLGLFLRSCLFLYAESTWLNVGMGWFGRKRRQWFEQKLLIHLQKTAPKKYHNILTPRFGVGCRRIIVDGGWLESLSLPNVELTTRPLRSIGSHAVVLGPQPEQSQDTGHHGNQDGGLIKKPTDVIILANGFETSTYLHRIKVQGRNGLTLDDIWKANGGPGAYLSTAVHGFPNFFMVLGPNSVSGHSSAILASENVAGYALNFIHLVLSGEAQTVEVRMEAEHEYTGDVQKRSLDKVWQSCKNGYIQEGGWNSSICPFNQIHFSIMCKYPNWRHWDINYTDTGIGERDKKCTRRRSFICLLALFATILPIFLIR
ncbi:FAD/NAD(P)-binding domain-containing protein [Colletotrichum somersetense]|nr:FAD/NAD(P)-binding domain-containing protein [Colletotrichum somersetense]